MAGSSIFFLFVFYQIKHFLADFPLQGRYMLQKTLPGWKFFVPLLSHAAVHGGLTLALCLFIRPDRWWLALVDFGTHFVMDRIKAGPKYLGRFRDTKTSAFWNALGFDQMVHQMVYIFIVWKLVTS